MAVISYTEEEITSGVILVKWTGLANGDTGSPYRAPNYNDKSVQVNNTFGTGGSVTVQGSNDSSNYDSLRATDGNVLTFSASGLEQVLENPVLMRPNVTAGDGSTNINVSLLLTTVARR